MTSFEKRMKNLANRVVRNSGQAMIKSGIVATQVVAYSTAVKTGFARGNWNPSIGAPDFSTSPAVGDGSTPGMAGATAAAAAVRPISKAVLIFSTWKPGMGPLFIANGTDYIVPLEDGHSAQGRDMAKKAVLAARNEVVKVRLFRP